MATKRNPDVQWTPGLREVPGYQAYAADEDGNIWSRVRSWGDGRPRKRVQVVNNQGYYAVSMLGPKGWKRLIVHKLVCAVFHGPKPTPKHEVRHLNGTRLDNRASNLAWGTILENARDRVNHGRCVGLKNLAKAWEWRRGRIIKPFCPLGHDKKGKPYCQECCTRRNRERYARLKAEASSRRTEGP